MNEEKVFWWVWIRDEYWGRNYYYFANPSFEVIESQATAGSTLIWDSAPTEGDAIDYALYYKEE